MMISSHAKSASNICRFADKLHKHVRLNVINFGISVHGDMLLINIIFGSQKNRGGGVLKHETPEGLEPKTVHNFRVT